MLVGVEEAQDGTGVAGEEGEAAVLAVRAPGDEVLLHEGLVAVEGDGADRRDNCGRAGTPIRVLAPEPMTGRTERSDPIERSCKAGSRSGARVASANRHQGSPLARPATDCRPVGCLGAPLESCE